MSRTPQSGSIAFKPRARLLKLLGLSKSGDHLVELGGQPVGHPPQQDRVSHLEPRFRSTHPPARTPRNDEQRGVHGHYHPPAVRAIDFHVHLLVKEVLAASDNHTVTTGFGAAPGSYVRVKG